MQISVQFRRAGTLAAAVALIAGLLATAPAVLSAGATPSTTTLQAPTLTPKPVGLTSDLSAIVTPNDATGTVTFYDVSAGTPAPLATVDLVLIGGLTPTATWTVPADFAVGAYQVIAEYNGDATYGVSDSSAVGVTVASRSTTTQIDSVSGPHDALGASAEQGDVITVHASVTDTDTVAPNPVAIVGSIVIKLDGTTVGQITLPATSVDIATTGATWAVGPHTLTAAYDPGSNTDHATSTSAGWPISLVLNTVQATTSVQYATFYPYKDGYRDTDAIRGNRLETASVKIKIISPTGSTVKQVAIASGKGTWSYGWNGRNSAGTILAAGKYTIRQTVTDAKGLAKTFTSYITLSHKRLYTYTVSLTKNAKDQVTKKAADNTWFGWSFTLPSATIYKKLVFSIYGRTQLPAGVFGPHNFAVCPSTSTWSPAAPSYCMTPWTTFPTSAGWKSVTGNVTNNRHGSYVRLYAVGGNNTQVGYARVTVTYQVLK